MERFDPRTGRIIRLPEDRLRYSSVSQPYETQETVTSQPKPHPPVRVIEERGRRFTSTDLGAKGLGGKFGAEAHNKSSSVAVSSGTRSQKGGRPFKQ